MSMCAVLVPEANPETITTWLTRHRSLVALTIAVALFHFAAFATLCDVGSWDHGPHQKVVLDMTTDGRVGSYFLYHLCVALVSGWSRSPSVLATGAALVLTGAVVARTLLSWRVLDTDGTRPARAVAFSMALLFAMPLWNWWKFPKVYLGQITPNIWHNPTTTFAMPLCVAVFLMAVSFLRQAGMWKAVALGLLTVACTLAKPNYVIAFVPCLAVVMTWRVARSLAARRREETTKTILHMICLFGPVLIGLVVQFLFTFAGRTDNDDRVIFAPLRAWGQYSPNVPASVVLGIAFPLVTLLLYPRETWADRRTLLAWSVLAVAIAQFALFAEEKRMSAANFAWGSYFADYVLFLLACALLMKQNVGPRFIAAVSVLALHTIAGALHLGAYLMGPVRTWVPD